MADQAQIDAWTAELTALEAAKTSLLTGKQTVSVASGDKRIEYRADASNLRAIDIRIAELKRYLGLSSRRALRIGF